MLILAVTDIPRMTSLFEQFEGTNTEIILATDIHRAIDQFDNRNPNLVIFQNYLSGFSADILYKHFASRLNGRDIRFVLISNRPEDAGLEQFEAVLDSNGSTSALESALAQLISGVRTSAETTTDHPSGSDLLIPATIIPDHKPQCIDTEADTGIYSRPVAAGKSAIISDFSLQLSATSNELQHQDTVEESDYRPPDPTPNHLASEIDPAETVHSRLKNPTYWLIGSTLLVVVAISLFQHRARVPDRTPKPEQKQAVQAVISSAQPPVTQPAPIRATVPLSGALPGFIPVGNADKQYAKAHPGWELYRGQTNEYRVYRNKDAKIKAIQVLDRSGAGIQEAFFMQALKELSGDTTISQNSTEIKEGYEIKRGLMAGLQLIQYRDAQGGRLRGFVVTWP